ncbi:hypothetical protein GQ457_02G019060 [Hibiscus cannabinus]
MEKPSELSRAAFPKIPRSHGGRPPDPILALIEYVVSGKDVQVLERHGSPISPEILPLAKRGRTGIVLDCDSMEDGREVSDFDTNMGEVDASTNLKGPTDFPALTKGPSLVQVRHDDGQLKSSFRDSLLGKDSVRSTDQLISELDVEVTDEDVLIGGYSVLPEIRFSNKVHEAIDEKLSKSVIIRLLGKLIGYRALLNRIQSLWNPLGEVQLIDLDNDCFLVRFAKEEDYVHVLTGGPWVIYGSYLNVQPWSRNFSTNSEYPERIMVWVRLPKLPYRYYTKSLFRYTANAIGQVVRIDYNTEDGKRGRFARLAVTIDLNKPLVSGIVIDGTRQDIEYEGLPDICFSYGKYGHSKDLCGKESAGTKIPEVEVGRDPKELFGPWMQVTNRRRRDSQELEDAICPVTSGTDMQLPFANCNLPSTSSHKGKETITATFHGKGTSGQGSFSGCIVSEHTSREMVMDLDVNLNGPIEKEVGGLLLEKVKDVASSERVVNLEITLNKENHTAVRIGESNEANRIKERRGRVLPALFRSGGSKNQTKIASALKSNLKQGPKPKKRDDRGSANPNLAGRISALVSELDKAKAAEAVHDVDSRDGNVQWRANGMFDQPGNTPDRLKALEPEGDRPWILEGISMNDHPDFHNLLSSAWKNDRPFHDNIAEFQDKSRKWSLNVFGHIEQRKNLILAHLKGVEKALERGCNLYIIELEISLKRALETVLEQEESLWFQRARTKCIQLGDRNIAYFHASTLSRRRRNHINMLHLPDGSWSNDHAILKGHAIDFFCTLLTIEARPSLSTNQPSEFYQFDNSTMQQVADMVDENGGWDWHRIVQWLPPDAVEKFAAVKPPRPDAGLDIPRWRWGENREFTVRSAYQTLHTPSTAENISHWSKFWKLPVPQRIRVFMWLVFHQRLMTNDERLGLSPGNIIGHGDALWTTRFSVFCWLIWKRRCNAIFGQDVSSNFAWIQSGNQFVQLISETHGSNNALRISGFSGYCWNSRFQELLFLEELEVVFWYPILFVHDIML